MEISGLISTLVYYVIGLVFCVIGYKIFDIVTPFDLNEEIKNHNLAAGLAVAGIFVGVAIVISASIL